MKLPVPPFRRRHKAQVVRLVWGPMSRFSSNLPLLCLLAGGLVLIPAGVASQTLDSVMIARTLLAFEDARFAAMLRAHTAWLRDALADDLSYVHHTGRRETKTQYLETVGSGNLRYDGFTPRERHVRLLGARSAVVGLAHARGVSRGRTVTGDIRYLAVYERNGDRWRLVAWQVTRIS